DGLPVGEQDTAIRRRLGILTESPGLYDKLSAERNLAFFARLYEVPAAQRDAQVRRYLELLGLWDRRHELVGGFSKGMKQKMAIARALIHEPRVLFLDEPTAALDPEMARVVRDFIADLRSEGRTIILCTHNLDEAERLCDRIAVLNTRLIAVDTPANLRTRLFGRRVAVRLRDPDLAVTEMVRTLPFVQAVEATDSRLTVDLADPDAQTPALVRALVQAGAEVMAVGEVEHSLEEVYFSLVNGD
ncbi:MAG: ABC transporter ATP-binding protein, partial [Chloroflexi bacterium]|nr:ABC transporter ATP-binding protein [Chloroflexota bacterium]